MDRRNFLSVATLSPLALALPNISKSDTLPVIRTNDEWIENLDEVFGQMPLKMTFCDTLYGRQYKRSIEVLTETGEKNRCEHTRIYHYASEALRKEFAVLYSEIGCIIYKVRTTQDYTNLLHK